MRILFASFASVLLAACNLSPMYGGGGSGVVAQSLAAIKVAPIEGRAGWPTTGRNDLIPSRTRL